MRVKQRRVQDVRKNTVVRERFIFWSASPLSHEPDFVRATSQITPAGAPMIPSKTLDCWPFPIVHFAFAFSRQLNQPSDGFQAAEQGALAAAPVVDRLVHTIQRVMKASYVPVSRASGTSGMHDRYDDDG